MKTLYKIALVCSVISMVISLIQYDWTEVIAWSIVTMYNYNEYSKYSITNK